MHAPAAAAAQSLGDFPDAEENHPDMCSHMQSSLGACLLDARQRQREFFFARKYSQKEVEGLNQSRHGKVQFAFISVKRANEGRRRESEH